MAALRKLGVRCVVAFSAVGSLREEIKPRDFLVPGQVIDRTKGVSGLWFLRFTRGLWDIYVRSGGAADVEGRDGCLGLVRWEGLVLVRR